MSCYSPYSVAEFAWALALAVGRRIVRAAHRTGEFDFRLDGLMGRDLHGRTVGVMGTGKIGTAFALIAHGFGMRLLGWDVWVNAAKAVSTFLRVSVRNWSQTLSCARWGVAVSRLSSVNASAHGASLGVTSAVHREPPSPRCCSRQ
ncbi:hypothetical protein SPURM210S_03430 [Streptomyces purpurascens]|nr:hypothetical protein GCM10010303_10220 [Streptomyces purpurascens]